MSKCPKMFDGLAPHVIAEGHIIGKPSDLLEVINICVIAAQPRIGYAPMRRVGLPRLRLGSASVPRLGGWLHQSGGRR